MSKAKTRAKKRSLSGLISRLVPDRLEEAYDDIENYLSACARLPGDQVACLAQVVGELVDRFGESVQAALYEFLCDRESALHKTTEGALGGGMKAAVAVLVPLLVAQFALAPAVALVVATLVVKVIATQGEQTLCEELTKRAHARATARGKASSRSGKGTRRPGPQRRTAKRTAKKAGTRRSVARTRRRGTERKSGRRRA
jgi:hypothetical protein